MKINKLTLENIRSYEYQEIKFPEGSVLLSGDIGSGKTSVLLAIEFALFGLQPGQKGSSLLKNGKEEGSVIMEFEINENLVIIERKLKRAKNISQSYCSIEIGQEKKELSVTELKDKVLELLDYPPEFSKKQNLLYRFTIYTPQEEMKQIILEDPKTRVNTLRQIFGVDKYKKVLENVSIIASKIREEKRLKEGMSVNLEKYKEGLSLKEEHLKSMENNLQKYQQELEDKKSNLERVQNEMKELSTKKDEKNKLEQEIEKTKIMIQNKKDSISNNKKQIFRLEEQISEINKLNFDENKIKELQESIQIKKQEIQDFNNRILSISSRMNSLVGKNEENNKIKEKLQHIEVCPTCLQDVNQDYKSNVIKKLVQNSKENQELIERLNKEKEKINNEIYSKNNEIQQNEEKIQELNVLKIRFQGIEEKNNSLNELKKSNENLEKDIKLLESQIQTLKSSVLEISRYDKIIEEKQKELEKSLKQERNSEIKVAELKKEIDFNKKDIEELKTEIQKTKKIREELEYLGNLENWLSNRFVQVISRIEKHVMSKLKQDFSKLFSEWFDILVPDNFNVRLDDEFTPIVEQYDYELEYKYLSGGERTAIALAYRLALNQVINSLMSKIKTRDILILDEPTDGFSEQQLDKMRDVLQELNVKQLIIVSHEQKIENFVENIIKFSKDKGVSKMDEINKEKGF